MSIRLKGLLIIGTTLITLYGAIFLFSEKIVMRSFMEYEREVTIGELSKVEGVIDSRLDALRSTNLDWSHWDDTYAYINGRFPQYVFENFYPPATTLENLKVDLMAFMGPKGQTSAVFTLPGPGGGKTDGASLVADIITAGDLVSGDYPEKSLRGLVGTSQGLILITMEWIQDNQGLHPPAGAMLVGRWLDQPLLSEMGQVVGAGVELISLPPVSSSAAELTGSGPGDRSSGDINLTEGAENKLVGHLAIHDLKGRRAGLLRAVFPREISSRGRRTVHQFLAILSGVFLLILILSAVVIDWGILRRIALLFHQVSRVAITGNHKISINLPGKDEVSTLADSINQMVVALNETERVLNILVESSRLPMIGFDATGRITSWNYHAGETFGWSDLEMVGTRNILSPGGSCDLTRLLTEVRDKGHMINCEMEAWRKDGSSFQALVIMAPVEGGGSGGDMAVAVILDITTRKAAERKMQVALKEKDLLLREVHHRIKNNLQTVSSMLDLAAARPGSGPGALRESQRRIQAMALIHENLYRSDNTDRINLRPYVEGLLEQLSVILGWEEKGISIVSCVADIEVSSETAAPCGLMINELVANAVEHAFEGMDGGNVQVEIKSGHCELVLTVADNGIGMPQTGELEGLDTLGLKLVRLLAEQLRGTVAVEREGGTKITVRCRLYEPGSRTAPAP